MKTAITQQKQKGQEQSLRKTVARKSVFGAYCILSFSVLFTSCQKTELTEPNAPSIAELSGQQESKKAGDIPGVKELFIKSTIAINVQIGNITLPLYKGQHNGQPVWYVVTESSNEDNARRLGVNFAPKLANALGTAAVQRAQLRSAQTGNLLPNSEAITSQNVMVDFEGGVDFSPQRIVVPGPNGFPPAQFQAGAVGDAKYSPLITTGNGIVLNATQIANASGVHDGVMSIDYTKRQVTLDQFNGFYNGKRILYLHQESSSQLVAAIEGSTWAPNLDAAPGLGSDDVQTSAREAIIPVENGELGVNNPDRQGEQSFLFGEGDPLNIIQEEPGDAKYSPVWDIHLVVWTDAAIRAGKRELLTDAGKVANDFQKGLLVSATPNSGVSNPSLKGLMALGAISNCPVSSLLENANAPR